MTRQFCDVCGKETYGNCKFNIAFVMDVQELDVCHECQKKFIKSRTEADISTYKKLRNDSF